MSMPLKGKVHPEMKFSPFAAHHFVSPLFLIHRTVLEFHGLKEFHTMGADGSRVLQ